MSSFDYFNPTNINQVFVGFFLFCLFRINQNRFVGITDVVKGYLGGFVGVLRGDFLPF